MMRSEWVWRAVGRKSRRGVVNSAIRQDYIATIIPARGYDHRTWSEGKKAELPPALRTVEPLPLHLQVVRPRAATRSCAIADFPEAPQPASSRQEVAGGRNGSRPNARVTP